MMRHNARHLALQALYQWAMTQLSVKSIEEEFFKYHINATETADVDLPYFKQLLYGTTNFHEAIDDAINDFVKRPLHEIDYIELAVLRLATYELLYQADLPHPVIINEALKLTKAFGSSDGYKFVNGVLDRVAKKHRPFAMRNNPPKEP